MGESLHSLSFANQNTYNTTGNVIPADNMFIDFGSIELTCYADMIMNQKPSLLRYFLHAGSNGDWDIKSKVKHGSKLYGKYASPRDAGNFVAGMVAASNGPLLESLTQLGYGAYNLSGNNKFKTALTIFSIACINVKSPSEGFRMYEYVSNGESKLSQLCIDLGKKYQHSKK